MKRTKNMIYKETVESTELLLYTENTSEIYYRHIIPALDNLRKKFKKGTYESNKAVNLWYYVATAAANMYNKEFCGQFNTVFTVTDRFTVAVELEKKYHEELRLEVVDFQGLATYAQKRREETREAAHTETKTA